MTDNKPTVLFLCTHNAGRSRMALGLFNHLAGDQLLLFVVDQRRSQGPQGPPHFEKRPWVLDRMERPHEVPQRRHGDSGRPQVLGERALAPHEHVNLVLPVPERSCQIPDVDLCTAEGLGPSDQVHDLHRPPLSAIAHFAS